MSTIRSTIFTIFPLILACMSVSAGAVIDWKYNTSGSALEDTLGNWKFMSQAASQDGALQLLDPVGNVLGSHTALVLNDVYDSSKDSQNNAAGTPLIGYSFESVDAGSLKFRAGTSGSQNQNASLTLLARGRPLLIIKLINNSSGVVVSGSGESEFSDSESWFNRARNFEVDWSSEGQVRVVFESKSGQKTAFDDLRFLAPGQPDEIQLQVGFGRATNKALRLESLVLTRN